MIIKKQDEESPSMSIYGWKIETPAPKGIFVARCLDVAINEKYTTEKYGKPGQYETYPAVRFLFGVKEGDQHYLVMTAPRTRCSGSPRSTLFKMISAWLGEFPDEFNPRDMIGTIANITIEQQTSQGGTTYGAIKNISGVPSGMEKFAPESAEFNELLLTAGADVGQIAQPPADPTLAPQPKVEEAIEPKPQTPTNGDEEVPF